MRGQPLTLYERERIELYVRGHWSQRRIGRVLHRNHSVIGRELGRNCDRDGVYRASSAHARASKRALRPHRRRLDADDVLRNWVIRHLMDGWSPQQVSGRIKNRPDMQMVGRSISHEAIYQYIYAEPGRLMGLYQYLTRRHKKRQRKFGRRARKDKGILFVTPIKYRPKEIDEKQEFGHWESDSMVFENHAPGLSVQRERLTHLTRITKLSSMKAEETHDAITLHVEDIGPSFFKSMTFDRGGEGAHHYKLRMEYNIDTYHCDPYCSWQKGAVENTNGLIRRYLPRSTDPSTITDTHVYAIQEKLNNRARKALQYKTPNEVFAEFTGRQVVH
jgi:IS30 family transposase